MALTYDGAGGLFTRLGKVFGAMATLISQQTAIDTEVDDVLDQLNDERGWGLPLQENLPTYRAAFASPMSDLRTVAEQILIEQVHAEMPLPEKTVDQALRNLRTLMIDDSETVDATTVSISATGVTGIVGTGSMLVNLVNPDGESWQNARAETLYATCITDAQINVDQTGRELWRLRGTVPADNLAYDWPLGSGVDVQFNTTSAADDAGTTAGVNTLTNSDFETFTVANTPDSWTIVAGVAGTTIFSVSTPARGVRALEFRGNAGLTLTKIKQTFGSASGTLARLKPHTRYAISFWARRNGAVADGVVRVSVQDGSGSIIGSSNVSVTISGLTTSYALTTLVFTTPYDVPTTHELVVELTTALTDTTSLYVDDLCVTEMYQAQPGSFYFLIIAGPVDFVIDDRWSIPVVNNNEGAFVRYFDLAFQMKEKGLLLPSAGGGAETIDDALIS